jgi:uncharacterized protein (DUF58 family)
MALFVPAFLLLFILSLVLRVDPFFTVIWFLLGMYALARLWTQRSVQHLQISRRFDDRAFTGDQVEVGLKIRNASRLPVPWLEISESLPLELTATPFPDQAITLGGREERDFAYTLSCRRRGYYTLGPLRLGTGDLLGIEERVLLAEEPKHMTVYPRVVSLEQLGLPTRSALISLPSRLPLFEDSTRIMGVREYQSGDSPRRIHWTATARTGGLVVKQYQPAIARETLMCLDLDWRDYPMRRHEATEQAIVVAASLANHSIVRERLPVGLATDARDPLAEERRRIVLPPRSERAQLMTILEVLARVQPATGARFVDLLREESVHLPWGSTLVLITGMIDDTLAETLLYLRRRGHATAVVLVQEASPRGDAGAPGSLAGIPVHRVWTDQDLAVWQ